MELDLGHPSEEGAPDNGTMTAAPYWEHFEHGADIGVRGCGATRAQAFEQAAIALTAVVAEPRDIADARRIDVECRADDPELLLVDWLNALVYEMAVNGMLFGRYHVELDSRELRASAWGEPVDPARHQPAVEVKGATYTALTVYRREDGAWVAQTVVDV